VVYSDAARTQVYATFEFDANGNLRAGSQLSHTISNLSTKQQYYYAITALNSEGDKISIAVGNFTTPSATDIEEVVSSAKSMALYPNPVRSGETVYISGIEGKAAVSLISLSGNLLRSEQFDFVSGEMAFSVGEIAAGVYFVRVVSGDESKTLRVIVR